MAASDVALRDLIHHAGERVPVLNQLHDVTELLDFRTMIEIKDPNVPFSAVDARIGVQVLADRVQRRTADVCFAGHDHANVGIAMFCVVLACLRAIAWTADVLEPV